MKSEKVTFTNSNGVELSGRLEFPVGSKPEVFAVFAHCFTCSKDVKAAAYITRALTQNRIAVLRFDFTGIGMSGGDFSESTFSSNIDDLRSAYEFLEKNHKAPQLMIGHSLGGTAVLHAAGSLENVKAVAVIASPYDPAHVRELLKEGIDEIREKGKATVDIGGRPFTITKEFIDDLEKRDSAEVIRSLKRALLILHSPVDSIVGIENAAEIYRAALHPKSFLSLDGADHLISNREDSRYAGDLIARWASRYVTAEQRAEELTTEKQAVARTGESGYTTDIRVGPHSLTGDEPESVGGNEMGPSPYGYLLAALGSCTGMTLRMYADRKNWDLKEVRVHLSHEKTHRQDCDDCEDRGSARLDRIERIIEIEGGLDEEQRDRLVQIANKCPVHKTLESSVTVHTKLRD